MLRKRTYLMRGTILLIVAFFGMIALNQGVLNVFSPYPIVLDIEESGCTLSPDATIIRVGHFYDLATKEKVSGPRPPAGVDPASANAYYWLEAAITFHPTARDDTSSLPSDGWLYDFHTQTATMLSDLPSAEQQRILTLLHQRIQNPPDTDISPNGKFVTYVDSIRLNLPGADPKIAQFRSFNTSGEKCNNPWKADSSGIYFVERRGFIWRNEGGPIRFLPVPKEYRE